MDFVKTYDISGGSADIILKRLEKFEENVSLQVDTDGTYNGTTDEIQLVQSNDRDLPLAQWHPLPEAPLVVAAADDSFLLSSFAFTAKYIALRYTQNDGTVGILTLTENFKK